MQLEDLYLSKFRCYHDTRFPFAEGVNIIIGPNGAGKTTILEAIHLLSLTRSFRTHDDRHLIERGNTSYIIRGQLRDQENKLLVQNTFMIGGGKKISVDGIALSSKKEMLGRFPVVIMVPEDLELARGPDSLRRAFIDRVLAVTDKKYLNELLKYRRLLKQRNAALRQVTGSDYSAATIWDAAFADCAYAIWRIRVAFFDEYCSLFSSAWSQQRPEISAAIEYLPVEYENAAAVREAMERSVEVDLQTRRTNIGPHRDRIGFTLDGLKLRYYGSLGEQKLFIITLKIVEASYLETVLGTAPVLLLDDLLATLDLERARRVIEELSGAYQTIISTTTTDGFGQGWEAALKPNQISLPVEREVCPV
ncbi:MAG TPA: DNA replication and repair protein RecF [bacterium]|nr:DNA replication and repair protein RecF [bacterium]